MKTNFRISQYTNDSKDQWDDFVQTSKNGTFLFYRDYMDYHKHRFADNSLLIWDDKDHLVGLLPANKQDTTLVSHGGLTYGGIISNDQMKTPAMMTIFEKILQHLIENGFQKVIYKAIPHIYHRYPAEEDLYALFRHGAKLYRRDVSTTIVPQQKIAFQSRRKRGSNNARKAGVICRQSDDYESFWAILSQNLQTVHGVQPVHTIKEITYLVNAFPQTIKLFGAFQDDEMIAGTVIYDTEMVAHAQYIGNSDIGRSIGALDLLFSHLITEVYNHKSFFDFGISTEKAGQYLNSGLIDFKEGFGGRAIAYDFYELEIT